MKTARIVCLFVVVATLAHFINAFLRVGIDEGAGLDVFLAGYLSDPWQAVIDSDLMVGLLMAAFWIGWREREGAVALAWIAALFWWGNLVLALYALWQLQRSEGSWTRFFLGVHAPDARPAEPRSPWPLPLRLLLYAAPLALTAWMVAGILAVGFDPIPTIGYLGGLGSLLPALVVLALRSGGTATAIRGQPSPAR